jgi:curved DNA-binding protein CbpA
VSTDANTGESDFGNSNVSPNDQSLDSQANPDVASDSVVPGIVADEDVTEQLAQPNFDSLDPYAVLGVPEQATNHQIKKTFHKLFKQYHPDRLTLLPNQQDAHNIFTSRSNANEDLMDPDKRREHDLILRSFHTAINNASNNVNEEDSSSDKANVFGKCDWGQIVACNFPQLKPLKCTFNGCNKLVHHPAQIPHVNTIIDKTRLNSCQDRKNWHFYFLQPSLVLVETFKPKSLPSRHYYPTLPFRPNLKLTFVFNRNCAWLYF